MFVEQIPQVVGWLMGRGDREQHAGGSGGVGLEHIGAKLATRAGQGRFGRNLIAENNVDPRRVWCCCCAGAEG